LTRIATLSFAVVLAVGGMLGGQSLPSASSVNRLLVSQDYSGALAQTDLLLSRDPKNSQMWLARGIALRGLKRTADSLFVFEHALSIEPKSLPALRGAAEAAFALHRPETGSLVQQLLSIDSGNPVVHAMAGSLAFEKGDCAEVLTQFEHAEPVISGNRIATLQFSKCLLVSGKPERAVDLLTSLETSEDETLVSYDLAYALFAAGRFEESSRKLERLLNLEPDKGEVWNLLGADYGALGRTEDALDAYRNACEQSPRQAGYYIDLARFAMEHSSSDAAIQVLNTAVERIPRSADLLTVRGSIYSSLGQDQKAEADFALAERVDPRSGTGIVGRSLHLRDQGKAAEAEALLRQELKKKPKDVEIKYFLAETLIKDGTLLSMREARLLLQDVLKHRANDPNVLLALAKTFLPDHETKVALPLLLRARQLDPQSPGILSRLLQVYRSTGMTQEAATAAADLRRLVTDNRDADLRRNRFYISAVR
jgi:tetratricopeptide (TPR) repeat protein